MITVTIGGVSESDVVLLDSLALVEVAYRGEVGMGGFTMEDVGGARNVPALKAATVDESDATPVRMFTGFIAPQRTLMRGGYRTGSSRVFDISVVDANTMLDDRLLSGSSADRPEETDYQRVNWLLGTSAMTGISAGVVPDAATVTMDAVDYRGTHPRRVLDECAEAASKNFFVYRYGTGPLLFYARHDVATLDSALHLSTVLSDIDNATTFPMEGLRLILDAQRVYSTIRLVYANGVVKVSNATTETTYRHREYHAVDNSILTEAKALAKAKEWLAQAAEEERTFACTVSLPTDMVNDIRAGQRIEVKAPHLGIGSFTWMRVTRREVMARAGQGSPSAEYYDLNLEFAPDIRTTRFGGTLPPTYAGSSVDDFDTDGTGPTYVDGEGGGGAGGDRPPNCIECPPSGGNGNGGIECEGNCSDTFNRVVADGWGTSEIYCYEWTDFSGGNSGDGWSVDGSKGIVEVGATSPVGRWLELSDATYPVEMRATVTCNWDRDGGSNGAIQFGGASITMLRFGGDRKLQVFAQSFDTVIDVPISGNSFELRILSLNGEVKIKAWETGDTEPSAWTVEDTHGDNILTPFQIAPFNSEGIVLTLDNLIVVEGLDCG